MILDILGLKVKVKYKDLNAENLCGKYVYDEKTIYINSTLPKEMQRVTLIHEFLHAAFDRAGLSQAKISHDAQEIICDQFAKALTENFKVTKKG
jgi:Zn-dependent peptidase ImmA (M78 family)